MSIAESTGAASQLEAALKSGNEQLSQVQTIEFTLYIRLVLPLDGFVFWVRADLLSKSALINAFALNQSTLNQPRTIAAPAPTVAVTGSFHYQEVKRQFEDEVLTVNQVVFTSEVDIDELDNVGPNAMYIGVIDDIQFSFSQRQNLYKQANLYHYIGDAVYPSMATQVIDSISGFSAAALIVSNSLPIWLAMAQTPPLPWQPPRTFFPVFPSFLAPTNQLPPYATVHIEPTETQALAAAPYIDGATSSHYQLASDMVRITFFGVNNAVGQDFMDAVYTFSINTDLIGLMNSPVLMDEKRVQNELGTLAQKKSADFVVSYYQTRVNDFALKTIQQAIPTYTLGS